MTGGKVNPVVLISVDDEGKIIVDDQIHPIGAIYLPGKRMLYPFRISTSEMIHFMVGDKYQESKCRRPIQDLTVHPTHNPTRATQSSNTDYYSS